MSKKPEFTWDETTGVCSCIIFLDDFLQGFGMAQCADEDRDVFSEKTGMHIAELRAQIDLLQKYKNNILRPGMKALEHLKSTMVHSPRFNPESYEAKRLNVEIKNYQKDIADINEAIYAAKQNLYDHIDLHEKIAKRIREKDHAGYKDEDSERIINELNFYEKVIKNDSQS